MTVGLADRIARLLALLEGTRFQREVCARLGIAVRGFQTVPTAGGDGGLDGLSDEQSHAYCCYGLEHQAHKTPRQKAEAIVRKFSSDLRRLCEIETHGRTGFKIAENAEIGSVLKAGARIRNVTLIANWFEDKAIIGRLNENFANYLAASEKRYIAADTELVIKGPQQFVDQYGVDEGTLVHVKYGDMFDRLELAAPEIALDSTHLATFDDKMSTARVMLPHADVDTIAEDMRREWRTAIAFERELSDNLPRLHRALEIGRKQLLRAVTFRSRTESDVWKAIADAQDIAERLFEPDFREYGTTFVRTLAGGEVAHIVGVCPLGWKRSVPPDAD